jgi:hypothetical protein
MVLTTWDVLMTAYICGYQSGNNAINKNQYHKVYFLSLCNSYTLIFDILRLEAFMKWFFLEFSPSHQFVRSFFHLISNFSRLFYHL